MITIKPLEPHAFDFFMDMHYESIHILRGSRRSMSCLTHHLLRNIMKAGGEKETGH